MAKKSSMTTVEYLTKAVIPVSNDKGTIVPHQLIIDTIKKLCEEKNLIIEKENYRCNEGAVIAQGIYHLKSAGLEQEDSELGLLFTWSNAYDRSARFKCSAGAYIKGSESGMLGENISNMTRKTIESIENEVSTMINEQLSNIETYFHTLVGNKNKMMFVLLTEKSRAELLGRLFMIDEVINTEQLSTIRNELAKPTHYTGEKATLWELFNAISFSLQIAHPKTWIDQQRIVNRFMQDHVEFMKSSEVIKIEPVNVTPENQLNIIDELKKIEETGITPVEQESNSEMTLSVEGSVFTETPDDENAGCPEPMQDPQEPAEPWTPEEEIRKTAERNALLEENKTESLDVIIADVSEKFPKEEPVAEPVTITEEPAIVESAVEEPVDDGTWPCLSCGETQFADSVWNDGQLCSKCAEVAEFKID